MLADDPYAIACDAYGYDIHAHGYNSDAYAVADNDADLHTVTDSHAYAVTDSCDADADSLR
jgi:hypothetical protein